jgi:N-acetylmuramoyl-L-alanine amidase
MRSEISNSKIMLCVLCIAALNFFGCLPKSQESPDAVAPATQPVASTQPMSLDEAIKLIDNRPAWTDRPAIDVPRHPAEKFLKDWVIVLDPGHGGEDGGDADARRDYKRGPAGTREAHMNWRVAVLLKRLLDDAGAKVILTRNGDETISLARRSQIANEANADLFLSIHHNAGGGPSANYTSVWYHGEVDWSEPDLDIATSIAHELGRAMRTQVAKTSPIFSDQLMYNSGFGVLQRCHMPAILCECSFYTDPQEEQRLRDAGYNLREAYGIYVGLCEYAYGGRPTQSAPVATLEGSQVQLVTMLDEGLPEWWGQERNRIITSSIQVTLDSSPLPIQFDSATKKLTASFDVAQITNTFAPVTLSIHHQNMFKHHNWPQRYRVGRGEGGLVKVTPIGSRRAASQPATRSAQ